MNGAAGCSGTVSTNCFRDIFQAIWTLTIYLTIISNTSPSLRCESSFSYANCVDDENSQAEGSSSAGPANSEGAVGYSSSRPTADAASASAVLGHPHYENIYESIDQYNATNADASAVCPAAAAAAGVAAASAASSSAHDNNNQPQHHHHHPNAAAAGAARAVPVSPNPPHKRHDPYERQQQQQQPSAYDVPRQHQSLFRNGAVPQAAGSSSAPSSGTSTRRAHLHLDLNPNRPRYTTASRPHRQRSFDDAAAAAAAACTESSSSAAAAAAVAAAAAFRCENIYEQIHEEPIYRNQSAPHAAAGARTTYARLGIIGHGIGRIERHLSSSCGNIDHYNLGAHYAVLGHSHLGTVGHIRLNAAGGPQPQSSLQRCGHAAAAAVTAATTAPAIQGTAANNQQTAAVRSLNLFSCLSRENSQSMTNIHRATSTTAPTASSAPPSSTVPSAVAQQSATGAIPKIPRTVKRQSTRTANHVQLDAPEDNDDDDGTAGGSSAAVGTARMSKSSLQWMLINRWLPMWIGQEPDYNVLDFNFMFSRQCAGGNGGNVGVGVGGMMSGVSQCAELHTTRHHSLMRPLGNGGGGGVGGGSLRPMRVQPQQMLAGRLRECEHGGGGGLSPYAERSHEYGGGEPRAERQRPATAAVRAPSAVVDPFRSWELNAEHNSFRPAQQQPIRRITDGTFPAASGGSAPMMGRIVQAVQPPVAAIVPAEVDAVSPQQQQHQQQQQPEGRRCSDDTEDDQGGEAAGGEGAEEEEKAEDAVATARDELRTDSDEEAAGGGK